MILDVPVVVVTGDGAMLIRRIRLDGRSEFNHPVDMSWRDNTVINFFLAKSKYPQKNPDDPIPKNFK